MDNMLTESLSEGNVNRKKSKDAKWIEEDQVEASKVIVDPEIAVISVQPPAGLPQMYEGLTETLAVGNVYGSMKMRKKIKTDTQINCEVQIMDQVKMDIVSIEDFTEGNVQVKAKEKRTRNEDEGKNKVDGQTIEPEHTIPNSSLSTESLEGKIDCKVTENIRASSELIEVRSGPLSRTLEVNEKMFPCESQHRSTPKRMAGENEKFESGLNDVNNVNITIFGAKHICSSDMKDTILLSENLDQCPRIAFAPGSRRKLLVLDVNGLLAYIVMPPPKDRVEDTRIFGRAIFKRPYCDDFLKFCFHNFDVGIWSSRSKKIIDGIVDYLLGDLKDKLLFCWDMSHSTQTGFKTLENIHKPLVFKELRNIWENDDLNIPWRKGDYAESNTLLLDDSPYKALLNPLHTAIFPHSYNYKDQDDKSLGPGGDLRVYLEGLLTSENVCDYVKHHPFGQSVINETSGSWEFYSGILQAMSNYRLQYKNPCPIPLSYNFI